MKHFFCIYFFFLILTCQSCYKKTDLPVTVIGFNGLTKINEWQLVGPFLCDSSEFESSNLLGHNFLDPFHLKEDSLTFHQFAYIGKEENNEKGILPDVFNVFYHIEDDHIDFEDILGPSRANQYGVMYAGCIIRSETDQNVVFLINDGAKMKAWLNQKYIFSCSLPHPLRRYYRYFVPAKLKKGDNFFLVKVRGLNKRFRINISDIEFARNHYHDANVANFLQHSILNIGDSLRFVSAIYDSEKFVNVHITNSQKEILYNSKAEFNGCWEKEMGDFKDGFYTCHVIAANDTFKQSFFYGDINKLFESLKKRAKELKFCSERNKINIDALIFRFEHLNTDKSKHIDRSRKNLWEKKVLYIMSELYRLISTLETGKEADFYGSGKHVHGFRSRIDGQIQYYMSYVPLRCIGYDKKVPLVIIVPFSGKSVDHFLKGDDLARIDRTEYVERLAEKYGMALLWPNARKHPLRNINDMFITDILEVLEDFKRDVDIDSDKIYLYGHCEGGKKALLFAERYPDYFTAIGVFSPVTSICKYNSPYKSNKWVNSNDILDYVENLTNIPFYVVHSNHDTYIPIEHSEKLVSQAQKMGCEFYFEKLDRCSHTLYLLETEEHVFSFFKDKVKKRHQSKLIFSTSQLKHNKSSWLILKKMEPLKKATIKAEICNNIVNIKTKNVLQYDVLVNELNIEKGEKLEIISNEIKLFSGIPTDSIISIIVKKANKESLYLKSNIVEGPLFHAFADGFIVVEGTLGAERKRNYFKEQVSEFRQKWQESWLVDCRYKRDIEITKEDIMEYHLILFGDSDTNNLIYRIHEYLPLTMDLNKIIVANKEYNGENLQIRMIFPNPLNPSKYVVIISSNNYDFYSDNQLDIWHNGFHDYQIWKYNSYNKGSIHLFDAGYFDNCWQ